MTKSVMLVGVGGQGTITAAKLLTTGLVEAGYDVKMSEIHGMSQRGGAVSSQVRYGEKVYSTVIEKGCADALIAFEKMEALRNISYLKKGGICVVNDYEINSMPILNGLFDYPQDINTILTEELGAKVIDTNKHAIELGNPKVMNVILLATLVKTAGLTDIDWEKIIRENVKEKFIDINIKAFNLGLSLV